MHIYRYIVSLADSRRKLSEAGLRDFYQKSRISEVDELFVIRAEENLEIYLVAPDLAEAQSVFHFLDRERMAEAVDVLADHDALRYFFNYVSGMDEKVPADPTRLLNIKEDYSIALDEGVIGTILTNMYHQGERLGNQLQSDPFIIKNSILLPEVLIDIGLKISGDLKNFQILFIGYEKQKINDVIQLFNKDKRQKLFIYDENFSEAYQIALELSCVPITEEQFDLILRQNTLIINYSRVRQDIFKKILDAIRINRTYLYIYFGLSENSTKQKIASPSNLYLQYIDQITSLIEQHTNNRRDYLKTMTGEITAAITNFYDWLYSDERHVFKGIVSADRRMQKVFDLVRRVAPSDISVLISGETGTGKELIARAIHSCSPRSTGRFVAVNCSAIPETLLESELFGYVRGAFTGAHTAKDGLIETASGGTLFLDEIGDLPPIIQVKLLRVLQEREIMHIGETKPIKIDIRLVTATNHDLEEMTMQGKFRSDLYYRVNTVQINLPALRDRRDDIALLLKYFVERLNRKSKKHISRISDVVLEKFLEYDWPGNIRELENVIERAFAVSLGDQITLNDLPQRLQVYTPEHRQTTDSSATHGQTLRQIEATQIRDLLINQRMTLSETARVLGIGRTTLWRKMREYGISKDKKN